MNKFRGTETVRIGEREYKLSFSMNTTVLIEAEEQTSILRFLNSIASAGSVAGLNFTKTRKLVWYALRDHHPEITIEEVGDILSTVSDNPRDKDPFELISHSTYALGAAVDIDVREFEKRMAEKAAEAKAAGDSIPEEQDPAAGKSKPKTKR